MRSLLMKHINAGLQTQKRDEAAAECAAQERLERRRKAAEVEAVRQCVRCQQSWRHTTTGAAATLAHVQHVAMSEDEWKALVKERRANEMVKESKERELSKSMEKLFNHGEAMISAGKITKAEFYAQIGSVIGRRTGIDLSAGMKLLNEEIEADDPVTKWYTARKKALSTAAAPPQHQPETCLWTFTLGAATFSAFPTFADGGKGGEKGEGRGSGGFEFIVPDDVAPAFLAAHMAAAAGDVSVEWHPPTLYAHAPLHAACWSHTHAYSVEKFTSSRSHKRFTHSLHSFAPLQQIPVTPNIHPLMDGISLYDPADGSLCRPAPLSRRIADHLTDHYTKLQGKGREAEGHGFTGWREWGRTKVEQESGRYPDGWDENATEVFMPHSRYARTPTQIDRSVGWTMVREVREEPDETWNPPNMAPVHYELNLNLHVRGNDVCCLRVASRKSIAGKMFDAIIPSQWEPIELEQQALTRWSEAQVWCS
jgi:hypothetical protein